MTQVPQEERVITGEVRVVQPTHVKLTLRDYAAIGGLIISSVLLIAGMMTAFFTSQTESLAIEKKADLTDQLLLNHINKADEQFDEQKTLNNKVERKLEKQSDALHRIEVNVSKIGRSEGVRMIPAPRRSE